jgi:dihydrofolate reductase
MSKLFLSMMVTLDGFTAGPDGDLGWTAIDDREFERHMAGVLAGIDAMLYGRVAYEYLSGYWPSAGTAPHSTDQDKELARLMNTIPKIVISRSDVALDWGPAERIGVDLGASVTRIKREAKKELALFAGASVASTLMGLNLIDEFRLFVFPVTLGCGQRLFSDGMPGRRFRTCDIARFDDSGVVALRYEPIPAGRSGS